MVKKEYIKVNDHEDIYVCCGVLMILHWENADSVTHKPAAWATQLPDQVLDFLPFSYLSLMIRLPHLLFLC